MKRRPRWLRWLSAVPFGYFWLPCRLCDEPYGGNEPGAGHVGFPESIGYCPRCAQVIERYEPLKSLERAALRLS